MNPLCSIIRDFNERRLVICILRKATCTTLKLISTNPLSPLSIKHNKVNTLSEMVFYSRVVFHMNTTKVDIFKK